MLSALHSLNRWARDRRIRTKIMLVYLPLYTSLYNGLIFAAVLVVLQIGIGTVLALTIAGTAVKGKKFLRISYFIPVVLSVTVVFQLWLAMYNGEYGLINKVFEALGLSYRQDWLSDGRTAIYALLSLYPLVWMLFYSLKDNNEIFVTNPFGFRPI